MSETITVSEWMEEMARLATPGNTNRGGLTAREIVDGTGTPIRRIHRMIRMAMSSDGPICVRCGTELRQRIDGCMHPEPVYFFERRTLAKDA